MTWKFTDRKMQICAMFVLLTLSPFQSSFAKHTKHKSSDYKNSTKNGWFLGLEGGSVKPSLDNSTTIPNGSSTSPPNNVDYFSIGTPDRTTESAVLAGYRFVHKGRFFPSTSLAVRYQHINTFKVTGMIQQYSLPSFTNYDYKFYVSSDILSLQGKATIVQMGPFSPYISAGVGQANNNFSNYTEQAVSGVTPRLSPDFNNHTTTNLTYNVGVGVDWKITRKLSASLGYEYANLGRVKSGTGAQDDWNGDSLSFGTLKTQTVLMNVTYQIT
jgi:opacity protein-like surface antigen